MVNLFHPRGFVLISKEIYNYKKIVFISSEEAKIKFDNSSTIFIDSRNRNDYSKAHIRGALNIPSMPLSISLKKINENFNLLVQPKELVIYCSGISCGSSEILAKQLIKMGYSKHIYINKDGFLDWELKDYPVEVNSTE